MIDRLNCMLLLIVLLTSCSGRRENDKTEKAKVHKPSLFQFAFIFTPNENNLSFPLWFNDSMLRVNSVRMIVRKTYVFDAEDSVNLQHPSVIALSNRNVYVVDPTGKIEKLRFTYFFDGEKIGSLSFHYLPKSMRNGYCFPFNLDTSSIAELSFTKNELPVKVHEVLQVNRKYTSFKNIGDNNKIFFLPNPAYWGALSVDSILHPHPDDKIVLGSPMKPVKSYKVRNKILEKDVMRFSYFKGTSVLKKMTWIDFPFSTVRTFQLDKKGRCSGFIDSLFSGNDYLKRTIATIWFDRSNLPVKVVIKHEVKPGEQRIGLVEVFRYIDYK